MYMKKVLIVLMVFLLVGCFKDDEKISLTKVKSLNETYKFQKPEIEEPTSKDKKEENDDRPNRVPVVPSILKPSTSISKAESNPSEDKPSTEITTTILNAEAIKNYNKKISEKSSSIYDLEKIKTMSKDDIKKLIEEYKVPSSPKYNNGTVVTSEEIDEILKNRDIENVSSETDIQKAIVTKRSNLKALPTDTHFYNKRDVSNFDQIQETELAINTPVLILHTSKDGKYEFVLSEIYAGWIKGDDLAKCQPSTCEYFDSPTSFIVITDSHIEMEGAYLDMGVTLPLLKSTNSSFTAVLPIRNERGVLEKKEVEIPKSQAHEGFLPYTKDNVISLSQKYLKTPYSWGGMDYGVDCSSFIMNIYRTFGFRFPRNTSDQKTSVGNITSLVGLTPAKKLEYLNGLQIPAILYQPGHAMLYLGKENGKHAIIHASGSDMYVVKNELTPNSSYLLKIDRVVTIS